MNLEQKINYQLNKYPIIKRIIKRGYQLTMFAFSPKIKSEGNIKCVSHDVREECFFGYYDKCPWDATGRYMLCMKAKEVLCIVIRRNPFDIALNRYLFTCSITSQLITSLNIFLDTRNFIQLVVYFLF